MPSFFNFLSYYRESLLLLIYILVSFLFIFSSDSKIVDGVRSGSTAIFGSVQNVLENSISYFNLREENRELKKENTQLAYENFQLQDALLENIRLRRLLQFKYDVEYDLIPAKVIGFNPQSIETGLLLSSTELDSVKINAAVLTADGLVGRVIDKTANYAICQNLTDPNNRVSARVQRNRILGMIKWDGVNALILDHVPNTIKILPGDVIFTSGFSKIYPIGIKIGVVTEVEKDNSKLFQNISVKPSVDFNRLEEVFIYQPL